MAGMDFDCLLFSARLATASSRNLLPPWKTGLVAVIFGRQGPLPVFQPVPDWTDPLPIVVLVPLIVRGPDSSGKTDSTARPFKRLRESHEGRDEKDAQLRAMHVRAWMNFILLNPQASRAGLQLECICDEATRVSTIEDILFDRRTGTLAARISALTMYAIWASSHDIPPNLVTPMHEELAYRYVCMLRSESTGNSSL
jgi:hypothetical protein